MTTSNQGAFERDGGLATSTTYVSRLTPVGGAAVSVVGVSGGTAWELLCSRWTDANGVPATADEQKWSSETAERPFFGLFHFDGPDGVADEVVLYRRTPDSFEIDCHGGDLATSRIVDFFESNGAIRISSTEWERRVERKVSGRSSLFTGVVDELFFAASEELIVQTLSEEAAKHACDQHDAWRDWFAAFREKAQWGDGTALVSTIDELLDDALGRYLTEPFVVALTGAPNVGKSSLLNAILGDERVVTSPISGTTRDLVGVPFVFGGWSYQLVDAAGLRETDDPIERAGIALAAELADRADVVVRVYDPTLDRNEQEKIFQQFSSENPSNSCRMTLEVLNKSDLEANLFTRGWRARNSDGMIRVSARERLGLEELLSAIFHATVLTRRGVADSLRRGRPLLWTAEQRNFIKRLRTLCVAGRFNDVVESIGF